MTARFVDGPYTLAGSAHQLPGPPVSNAQLLQALEQFCGKTLARKGRLIARRLGIKARHLSRSLDVARSGPGEGKTHPELGAQAINLALEEAGLELDSVDYILGHTTTPHTLLPPGISWVADQLDYSGPYLELRQACTGFASALQIAAGMLSSGQSRAVALLGSENGSTYFDISPAFLNEEQLINYVQMGDGAGAVILVPDDGSGRRQISELFVGQIGLGKEPGFQLHGGGSSQPWTDAGFPVFEHNARSVRAYGGDLFVAGIEAVTQRGYELDSFDWVIPHQANGRLDRLMEKAFGIPRKKVWVTADTLGNLGSAAIWVSLDRLIKSGQLKDGDRVLILGAEASKYLYGGFIYQH